jgi:hypothetical protein
MFRRLTNAFTIALSISLLLITSCFLYKRGHGYDAQRSQPHTQPRHKRAQVDECTLHAFKTRVCERRRDGVYQAHTDIARAVQLTMRRARTSHAFHARE